MVGEISHGILALVGVQRGDSETEARRLLQRVLAYRIFPDSEQRMNLDLRQAQGSLLLVPQFTLAADTNKGNRASFTSAAPPEEGERLFRFLVERAKEELGEVATGEFGAHMKVHLINDGPVTFWLQTPPAA